MSEGQNSRRNFCGTRQAVGATVMTLLVAVAGCDVLDTNDPTTVTPSGLQGPNAVPTIVNGVIGDFQEGYDNWAMNSGIFTDVFILSGSGSRELDDRVPGQGSRSDDTWEDLHISRRSADTAVVRFQNSLGTSEFSGAENELREGLALANFYGGYVRLIMGEAFCQAILDSRGTPVSSDESVNAAISKFDAALEHAQAVGRGDLVTAIQIAKARANLWLRNFSQAASLVEDVPTSFVFWSYYSGNSIRQVNFVMAQTFGVEPAGFRRFAIGDGTADKRDNERFAYFDKWVEQGLIDTDPGMAAMDPSIPLNLQQLYTSRSHNISIASGWEARMIEAEAMIRNGDSAAAESMVNDLLTSADQSLNPMSMVNAGLDLGPFDPVDFNGNLQHDLRELARARTAGLWLSGERTPTFRRFLEDGVDMFPDRQGDATCWPFPEDEELNNPNV